MGDGMDLLFPGPGLWRRAVHPPGRAARGSRKKTYFGGENPLMISCIFPFDLEHFAELDGYFLDDLPKAEKAIRVLQPHGKEECRGPDRFHASVHEKQEVEAHPR